MGPRSTKKTALLVTLVYLSLTILMMVRIENHALNHDHDHEHNHAAQHASFICNWMCASSTYTHTAGQNQIEGFNSTPDDPAFEVEPFFSALPLFSFHIRPPPFSLS